MPPAARVSDIHICPKVEPVPHVGGTILPTGEPTVLIGCMPAARKGDTVLCLDLATIAQGASTVLIGNKPAARKGDETSHGGVIILGFPTVRIGNSPQGASFMGSGAPLVQQCEDPKAPLSV